MFFQRFHNVSILLIIIFAYNQFLLSMNIKRSFIIKKLTLTLCMMFLVVISTILYAQASKSAYQIVNKIHLEGDGGWDYPSVDENNGRLYLSHGNIVQVVDLKEGKLAGAIPDTKGVHGIAFASDLLCLCL